MNETNIDENLFGKGATDRPEDFMDWDEQERAAHLAQFQAEHDAWEKLSDEDKAKTPEPYFVDLIADPQHSEVAAAMAPAVWIEKDPMTGFKTYPKRNQGSAGDCVTYWIAKQVGVDNLAVNGVYRDLSPHSVYPFVFTKGGGSNTVDVANFVKQNGITLESLYPSDGLTEEQAEDASGYTPDAKIVAQVFKIKDFVLTPTDFESIASILYSYQQQGIPKTVGITLIGQNNGTVLSMYPQPPQSGNANPLWYHKLTVTDFGLINGKKFLSFDNSWGETPGNKGQQFIGEEYQPYIYGGIYSIAQSKADVETIPQPPVYTWSQQLQSGSTGPDVVALQQALQSLGMFPRSSLVQPTGNFYGITQAGVKEFQATFDLPVTGIVDAVTIEQLNKIFGPTPTA